MTDHAHAVLGTSTRPPWPEGHTALWVGMGCFWGAERLFWGLGGVHTTAVGYAGGHTAQPTYDDVCGGRTGHAEVALIAYNPDVISTETLLAVFWENHDPTQVNQQGNDIGTQYRSVIFTHTDEQHTVALRTRDAFGELLHEAGCGPIATEIVDASDLAFHYAEDYHQQYLHKNPGGYCNHGPNGFTCPTGLATH